jgi:phage recombination protein Bet
MPAAAPVDVEQWRVLTDAIFPGAKSAEAIVLALNYCKARGLDVFKKPVHIVPMWNSTLGREVETVWPGINELQTTAARTGHWAGMDPPTWGPMKRRTFTGLVGRRGQERNTSVVVDFPEWCEVTVYRMINGQRCAFSEPVYWEECYARMGRSEVPNDTWQRRARGQLHKCAKAASLRAAFPEDGSATAEEMEGRAIAEGGIVIDHDPPPQTPPQNSTGLQGAKQDHDASRAPLGTPDHTSERKPLTNAQFLQDLDRQLEAAPDSDAIAALLHSERVALAKKRLVGDARQHLAHWIGRAEGRLTELRNAEQAQAQADDAAEAAIETPAPPTDGMPPDIDDWPMVGEDKLAAG